jgi:hypothetical protein
MSAKSLLNNLKLEFKNASDEVESTFRNTGVAFNSTQLINYTAGSVAIPGGVSLTVDNTPVGFNHVANKSYVDSVAAGLHLHEAVVAATTDNIADLGIGLEAGDTLDGVTLTQDDRVLVKDQTDAKLNGIYVVGASGAPVRADDLDETVEAFTGVHVFVMFGSVNIGKGFVITGDVNVTIGSENMNWTQFSSPSTKTFGTGLTTSANGLTVTLDVDYVSTALQNVQNELDLTQAGAGLDIDGGYTADSTTNYIKLVTSLTDADAKLDTQLKTTDDLAVSAKQKADINEAFINGVTSELTTTQIGAGLDTDGTYSAPTGSTYLAAVTSLYEADGILDSSLNTVNVKANTIQTELTTTQIGAGLDTNGTYTADSTTNYIKLVTSLANADFELDAQLKTTDGVAAQAKSKADENEGFINSVISELTATQGGAGLDTDGTFIPHTTSNYINVPGNLHDVDIALDTQLGLTTAITANTVGTANLIPFCDPNNINILTTHSDIFHDGGGGISVIAVASTSDRRFKTNIVDIEESSLIHQLRPVQYNWKRGDLDQRTKYGFIAQEMEEVFPSIVRVTDDRYGIEYTNLIAHLVKEVQLLRQDVNTLKSLN